ncbi:hypothetical protein H6G89_21800 [Oscillatoria sp. FACHB-1407]|uniref:hypothetical protein n=1 Tax=Oscillatoria sp. FACHB-1407 TaxID=2692847 RepID=UPI0016865C19|nr:hypothetical protein [Oscillatoria sp. FACHB-1407]MBD2463639.1 hypothetical protein [Oscillatoria sp. FACHB-1407]
MLQTVKKQLSQTTPVKQKESSNNLPALVSWLFLIGSLIFQMDAMLELTEGISIHAILHMSASSLFTIGSILFVVHDTR